jgi:geranylgeranyl pyrophosphate synthase
MKKSGALEYAHEEAKKSAQAASDVLDSQTQGWDKESVEFLRQLVQYLVIRKS